MLLHKAGQVFYVLDWSFGQDAVTKVEDMAGASGGELKDVFGASLQFFPIREKQDGIEIALYGAAMVEGAPAPVEWDAPVEANDLGSSFIHGGKERGAVGAEINNRRSSFLQTLDEAGDVRKNVTAIVFHPETSNPAIENLNYIGAGPHLRE